MSGVDERPRQTHVASLIAERRFRVPGARYGRAGTALLFARQPALSGAERVPKMASG